MQRLSDTSTSRGNFAQRGHSANCYVVYPGNAPKNHPPIEACMTNSKQHGVQILGPWDPWLPVLENSRLFAQRAYSSRCALQHHLRQFTDWQVESTRTGPDCIWKPIYGYVGTECACVRSVHVVARYQKEQGQEMVNSGAHPQTHAPHACQVPHAQVYRPTTYTK